MKKAFATLALGMILRENVLLAAGEGGIGPAGNLPGQHQPKYRFNGVSEADQSDLLNRISLVEDPLEGARFIVQILENLESTPEFRGKLVWKALEFCAQEVPERTGKDYVEHGTKGTHPHYYQHSFELAAEALNDVAEVLNALSVQYPALNEDRVILDQSREYVASAQQENNRRIKEHAL